jgi:hypothetical protein
MDKIIIALLAALFSGCASMSPSERAWQTLHVLDVAQTLNTAGSNDPCWREYGIPTKYLIGEKPDPEAVIAWGVGLSILHYYADRWLERSDFSGGLKTAIRSINLTGKGFTVVKNHTEGARPFGDNARSCI